jgi:glutathione S-transferase
VIEISQHEHNRLWESSIINEYLEEVFLEPPLMLIALGLTAIAGIWLDFADTKFMPVYHNLMLSQDVQQQQHWRDKLQPHVQLDAIWQHPSVHAIA